MSKKVQYSVRRVEVKDAGVYVWIEAQAAGAVWGFWVKIEWSAFDAHALYDGVARYERSQYEAQRWDQGQDAPLF